MDVRWHSVGRMEGGRDPPSTPLKDPLPRAEAQGEMTMRPLEPRRLVAALTCLVVALLPQPASSSRADRGTLAGEVGSGPKAWRVRGASAADGVAWSDVPKEHWARAAIDHVGAANDWMRDYRAEDDGSYPFRPDALERRMRFARTLVRAFAPDAQVDPEVAFADLPAERRSFRWANLSVSLGWMVPDEQGNFRSGEPVTMREVHRALVLALGLGDLAAGADALHLRDGTEIPTPPDFGTTLIGMRLGLRYNHGDESRDVGPDTPLPRAEVAWSLYRAATAPTWIRDSLAPYASMELPNLSPKLQRVVAFGAAYVGQPYVWGGEWGEPTPVGYCCGYQPVGGFDCSGIVWWVIKAASGGWDNQPPREYKGWSLAERSSAQMAGVGDPVAWLDIRPGDLLFYDGNEDGTVDHVNVYLGNGWAIDSGSGNAGVAITFVLGTWYEDHFVHARRILAS